MKPVLSLAIALIAIPIAAIAQDSAPTTPEGFVKARVEKMGRGGDEIGVMMETLDSEGDLRALAPRIERLVQWSEELPTLFPEGSVTAASEARPEVWSDRAGFLAAAAEQSVPWLRGNNLDNQKCQTGPQAREVLTWELAQKYFLDPTFGGALVTGLRNVFTTTADLTGIAFITQPRHLSPLISRLRIATLRMVTHNV